MWIGVYIESRPEFVWFGRVERSRFRSFNKVHRLSSSEVDVFRSRFEGSDSSRHSIYTIGLPWSVFQQLITHSQIPGEPQRPPEDA